MPYKILLHYKYLLFLLVLAVGNTSIVAQQLNHIYKAGEEGYSCFRIPAMITTTKGTILAFAEGRRNNCGDAGDIDLVVKRSLDGGKSWSSLALVWSDSTNTCGNPAPVVDLKSGKIILLSTWNLGTDHEKDIIKQVSKDTRRVYVISSSDDGNSWSVPKDITADVKPTTWTWYATGPGSGIQIRKGKYKGRMLVACDHIEAQTNKYFSHCIYSDDRGSTWKLGGTTPQDKVNESTVAELAGNKVMLNMRNFGTNRVRLVSISKDGGKSFGDIYSDSTLIEPVCQGSLISMELNRTKRLLAFSNPASSSSRSVMTVRVSYDEGSSWPLKKVLYQGPSAYSNLTALPGGKLACLYEAGYEKAYEGIVFELINISELVRNE